MRTEDEETVAQYRGVIAIEWPPAGGGPYSAMAGCKVSITDLVSGKPVRTCHYAEVIVRADAQGLVDALLALFADEDGEPIFDGDPVERDGEILTGVFPFLVGEMKVRQQ